MSDEMDIDDPRDEFDLLVDAQPRVPSLDRISVKLPLDVRSTPVPPRTTILLDKSKGVNARKSKSKSKGKEKETGTGAVVRRRKPKKVSFKAEAPISRAARLAPAASTVETKLGVDKSAEEAFYHLPTNRFTCSNPYRVFGRCVFVFNLPRSCFAETARYLKNFSKDKATLCYPPLFSMFVEVLCRTAVHLIMAAADKTVGADGDSDSVNPGDSLPNGEGSMVTPLPDDDDDADDDDDDDDAADGGVPGDDNARRQIDSLVDSAAIVHNASNLGYNAGSSLERIASTIPVEGSGINFFLEAVPTKETQLEFGHLTYWAVFENSTAGNIANAIHKSLLTRNARMRELVSRGSSGFEPDLEEILSYTKRSGDMSTAAQAFGGGGGGQVVPEFMQRAALNMRGLTPEQSRAVRFNFEQNSPGFGGGEEVRQEKKRRRKQPAGGGAGGGGGGGSDEPQTHASVPDEADDFETYPGCSPNTPIYHAYNSITSVELWYKLLESYFNTRLFDEQRASIHEQHLLAPQEKGSFCDSFRLTPQGKTRAVCFNALVQIRNTDGITEIIGHNRHYMRPVYEGTSFTTGVLSVADSEIVHIRDLSPPLSAIEQRALSMHNEQEAREFLRQHKTEGFYLCFPRPDFVYHFEANYFKPDRMFNTHLPAAQLMSFDTITKSFRFLRNYEEQQKGKSRNAGNEHIEDEFDRVERIQSDEAKALNAATIDESFANIQQKAYESFHRDNLELTALLHNDDDDDSSSLSVSDEESSSSHAGDKTDGDDDDDEEDDWEFSMDSESNSEDDMDEELRGRSGKGKSSSSSRSSRKKKGRSSTRTTAIDDRVDDDDGPTLSRLDDGDSLRQLELKNYLLQTNTGSTEKVSTDVEKEIYLNAAAAEKMQEMAKAGLTQDAVMQSTLPKRARLHEYYMSMYAKLNEEYTFAFDSYQATKMYDQDAGAEPTPPTINPATGRFIDCHGVEQGKSVFLSEADKMVEKADADWHADVLRREIVGNTIVTRGMTAVERVRVPTVEAFLRLDMENSQNLTKRYVSHRKKVLAVQARKLTAAARSSRKAKKINEYILKSDLGVEYGYATIAETLRHRMLMRFAKEARGAKSDVSVVGKKINRYREQHRLYDHRFTIGSRDAGEISSFTYRVSQYLVDIKNVFDSTDGNIAPIYMVMMKFYDTYRSELGLHFNLFLSSEKGGPGKSFTLEVVYNENDPDRGMMIPGTCSQVNRKTKTADQVDKRPGISYCRNMFSEEMNRSDVGVGKMADADRADQFKALLTGGRVTIETYCTDPSGLRKVRSVKHEIVQPLTVAANWEPSLMSHAFLSRWLVWRYNESLESMRIGRTWFTSSMHEYRRENPNGTTMDRKKVIESIRQLQSLYYETQQLIRIKVLPKPTRVVPLAIMMQLENYMMDNGLSVPSGRCIKRVLMLAEIFCIHDALCRLFHQPDSPFANGPIEIEMFRHLGPYLHIGIEHTTHAMFMCMEDIMPRGYHQVVKGLRAIWAETQEFAPIRKNSVTPRVKEPGINPDAFVYSKACIEAYNTAEERRRNVPRKALRAISLPPRFPPIPSYERAPSAPAVAPSSTANARPHVPPAKPSAADRLAKIADSSSLLPKHTVTGRTTTPAAATASAPKRSVVASEDGSEVDSALAQKKMVASTLMDNYIQNKTAGRVATPALSAPITSNNNNNNNNTTGNTGNMSSVDRGALLRAIHENALRDEAGAFPASVPKIGTARYIHDVYEGDMSRGAILQRRESNPTFTDPGYKECRVLPADVDEAICVVRVARAEGFHLAHLITRIESKLAAAKEYVPSRPVIHATLLNMQKTRVSTRRWIPCYLLKKCPGSSMGCPGVHEVAEDETEYLPRASARTDKLTPMTDNGDEELPFYNTVIRENERQIDAFTIISDEDDDDDDDDDGDYGTSGGGGGGVSRAGMSDAHAFNQGYDNSSSASSHKHHSRRQNNSLQIHIASKVLLAPHSDSWSELAQAVQSIFNKVGQRRESVLLAPNPDNPSMPVTLNIGPNPELDPSHPEAPRSMMILPTFNDMQGAADDMLDARLTDVQQFESCATMRETWASIRAQTILANGEQVPPRACRVNIPLDLMGLEHHRQMNNYTHLPVPRDIVENGISSTSGEDLPHQRPYTPRPKRYFFMGSEVYNLAKQQGTRKAVRRAISRGIGATSARGTGVDTASESESTAYVTDDLMNRIDQVMRRDGGDGTVPSAATAATATTTAATTTIPTTTTDDTLVTDEVRELRLRSESQTTFQSRMSQLIYQTNETLDECEKLKKENGLFDKTYQDTLAKNWETAYNIQLSWFLKPRPCKNCRRNKRRPFCSRKCLADARNQDWNCGPRRHSWFNINQELKAYGQCARAYGLTDIDDDEAVLSWSPGRKVYVHDYMGITLQHFLVRYTDSAYQYFIELLGHTLKWSDDSVEERFAKAQGVSSLKGMTFPSRTHPRDKKHGYDTGAKTDASIMSPVQHLNVYGTDKRIEVSHHRETERTKQLNGKLTSTPYMQYLAKVTAADEGGVGQKKRAHNISASMVKNLNASKFPMTSTELNNAQSDASATGNKKTTKASPPPAVISPEERRRELVRRQQKVLRDLREMAYDVGQPRPGANARRWEKYRYDRERRNKAAAAKSKKE